MVLSLFDQQLFEKVVAEKFPEKTTFAKTDILVILNEMTKAEKYYPKGKVGKQEKYKVFKYFVRYCLYRNLANFDTMILLSGDKGVGKSSFAIQLAREWCRLLGINFSVRNHMAYSNAQVTERINNSNRFAPLICLSGKTKIVIKRDGVESFERISRLENKNDFEVLSYDVTNKIFEFVKPDKCVMTNKCAKAFTLELENGVKINATKDHRFLLKDGTYKPLEALCEGDELVMYSITCKWCNKEFIPISQEAKYCSKKCSDKYGPESEKRHLRKIYQIEYRKKNRERRLEWGKEYRFKNVEIIKERKRLEREKNKEKYKLRQKIWWEKNKVVYSQKNKEWRKNNRPKLREYFNKVHKIKMINDPVYKIKRNLRRRTNLALKDQDVNNHVSLTQYLGCTIKEFQEYIKSKFSRGMNMNNYGKVWHIDHIKPCASFNLVDINEQKKCFHYTNLQPLFWEQNLKKGYKNDY